MDKPDYILNFDKPKNTEIKYINGNWYLYERHNIYDPKIKRSRKKSGKIIGKITEKGLTLSKAKKAEKEDLKNDVVEIGAVKYFQEKNKDMEEKLKNYFPDLWKEIYSFALIRAIYDCRFRRLQLHYDDSILSYIYPNLRFDPKRVSEFLNELGHQRNTIEEFMEESIKENNRFILFDGHRLLSSSKSMENAELGYDSKHRYKPQINLIYMFSLGENTGYPVYYKQFMGSTPDVTAFSDVLKTTENYGKDCTIVGDKGFASEEDFSLICDKNLKYIIPLKRGNRYVKDRVPVSPFDYEDVFTFNDRAIQSITFEEDDFNIHLFLDTDLYAQEIADLTKRTEKKNDIISKKIDKEQKKRINNKGKLSDEELESLVPITLKDMLSNKQEIGTITIKTNRKDLNAVQVYCIYKQRQSIEQFFKTYGDTMEFEASYMRNNYCEEAWLFLNHLSSIISINMIEDIAAIGESKNISYKDLVQTLTKIKANIGSEKISIVPIKKSVNKLCSKLNYDPTDLSNLNLPDD